MKEKLMELTNMTDADFYDNYVSNLSLEDQAKFFKEFPEFLDAAEMSGSRSSCEKWERSL